MPDQMIKRAFNFTELCELDTHLHLAGAVSLNDRDPVELFNKWRYAMGRNWRIVTSAIKAWKVKATAMLPEHDVELDDYSRQRAALVERFADPKQVRKDPDQLQPGERENVRLDPTRVAEYDAELAALEKQFASAIVRRDEMKAKLEAFQNEPIELEFYGFPYGLNAVPLDVNGSYMAQLDWLITEPDDEQIVEDALRRSLKPESQPLEIV